MGPFKRNKMPVRIVAGLLLWALLSLPVLSVSVPVPSGTGRPAAVERISLGAQRAEAWGWCGLPICPGDSISRLDKWLAEIPQKILESIFHYIKDWIIHGVLALLTGQDPFKAMGNFVEGLLGKVTSEFQQLARDIIDDTLDKLNTELNMALDDILKRKKQYIEKARADLGSDYGVEHEGKSGIPATSVGGGLPNATAGTMTVVTEMLREKHPVHKDFAQLQLPQSGLPDAIRNTFSTLTHENRSHWGMMKGAAINAGEEAKNEYGVKVLVHGAALRALSAELDKMVQKEPEQVTNTDWSKQDPSKKSDKAWYDALKSKMAQQSRTFGLYLLMLQYMKQKDLLLALYTTGRVCDYARVFESNMLRYVRVYETERSRIWR